MITQWGRAILVSWHATVSKDREPNGVGGVKAAWPICSSLHSVSGTVS